MRKIISFMHVSLDGFTGGPNGEMDWIRVDSELFELASQATEMSDLAIYGRVTWEMMDGYWPTAGDSPNASKHDKEHSAWYNKVEKIVLSKTLSGKSIPNATIISDNVAPQIRGVKEKPGKQIVMFGSPSAVRLLIKENLVDEFWLFVNPVLLGKGIPMFPALEERKSLELLEEKRFKNGVILLKFSVK
ncbi:MAG TPA: dihydrofolate reductase family protein [Puia sp.]|jgi:dihydrofolate reductase|nr:dihydrofolate reductase family protein [Puia sp.]